MTEIVLGEASESDEDANFFVLQKDRIFASEVSGEATESDDDMYEISALNQQKSGDQRPYSNNVLRQKLVENNIAIWKDISLTVRQFVSSASKQLSNTDHILTKSQISILSVLSSLKIAKTSIQHLHEKSSDALTTNFLPKINIL